MKVYFGEKVLWDKVVIADSFFTRLRGLMWKKNLAEGEGLLIKGCNQVHSFNMRFPIDVLFLSKQMEVLNITTMQPGEVGEKTKNAVCVLEVCAGSAKEKKLESGDFLEIM